MKSNANYSFSQVPPPQLQRSLLNRSCTHKTTFDEGYLIPIFDDEVLPGDTFTMDAQFLARLSTPIFPIMDNIFLDFFFFFVPYRLLWTNFEKFMGSQDNPGDSIDYVVPVLSYSDPNVMFTEKSIYDYFGLPTQIDMGLANASVNALAFRAYYRIWNDWFRDENLQNKLTIPTGDGPDVITTYTLQKRGKRHDYFTSCLPWPQKGNAVLLPIGSTAPVRGDGQALGLASVDAGTGDYKPLMLRTGSIGNSLHISGSNTDKAVAADSSTDGGYGQQHYVGLSTNYNHTHLYADLSVATASSINSIRTAFAQQKFLERDARGGTRFTEIIKAHFRVINPDFRLQRPEYLGGSTQRINISQVAQTSVTAATPQGNLAAYGHCATKAGFHKSFTEWGVIIGLANVRADLTYQQGLDRRWSRQTRYDFYWPEFANLGEQAVLNQEIYFTNNAATNAAAFGYQERWAEYRYKRSMVTGAFRSNYPGGGLDAWHLALNFGSLPALNAAFIQDDPPIERIVAVTSQPHVIMDSYFYLKCARPMPVYSVPGQLDRF